MTIVERLASALGRRDDRPNRELAAEIAEQRDRAAVKELAATLGHEKRAVRGDALKALAALSKIAPEMVAPYWEKVAAHLEHRDPLMMWLAMIALWHLSEFKERELFAILPRIVKAAGRGSIIARDHAVRLYARFAADAKRAPKVLPILLRELRACPHLQFGSYVEKTLPVVTPDWRAKFLAVISTRMAGLPRPSEIRRVEKALRAWSRSTATPASGSKLGV